MRKWEAVKRNEDATTDASHYVENGRFRLEGELQRRLGLTKLSASTGGLVIAGFWHPVQGQRVLFFRSTGVIEEIAAT